MTPTPSIAAFAQWLKARQKLLKHRLGALAPIESELELFRIFQGACRSRAFTVAGALTFCPILWVTLS